MSDLRILQFGVEGGLVPDKPSGFGSVGYTENPFPPTGENGPFYWGASPSALADINQWLADVQRATLPTKDKDDSQRPVRPLAIRGALGVGKTHLLRTLETGLSQQARFPVLRKNLADSGMTRLLLSSLLLSALPNLKQTVGTLFPVALPSIVPLLDEIAERARNRSRAGQTALLSSLRKTSLLKMPLTRILEADAQTEADLRRWLALWISRSPTTATHRAKLGVPAPLEGEGQAISVLCELASLARRLDLLQTWFVFLDQIEEIWRPRVITEGRAARFLTDLRTLIDEAQAGAPIALLLAWNTTTHQEEDEDELAQHYRALWQRLGRPVLLSGLAEKDLWPFAAHYLKNTRLDQRVEGADAAREHFSARLQTEGLARVKTLLLADKANAVLGSGRFAHRMVLRAWQQVAQELL
jgi:hypothetical protein